MAQYASDGASMPKSFILRSATCSDEENPRSGAWPALQGEERVQVVGYLHLGTESSLDVSRTGNSPRPGPGDWGPHWQQTL